MSAVPCRASRPTHRADHQRGGVDHVIILYDGECGFCRWTTAWALRRDRHDVLAVAPIQSPTGATLLADLAPTERTRSVHVVHADASRDSGAPAVLAVLSALPSTAPLARLLAAWPRGIGLGYRLVAGHRREVSRLVPARAKRKADGLLARAAST